MSSRAASRIVARLAAALCRQAVGDQVDVVGLGVHGGRGLEGTQQAGACGGRDGVESRDRLVELFAVRDRQPLAGGVGQHGRGPGIEHVDLVLAVARQLCAQPVDGRYRAAPLGRAPLHGFGHVAHADHVDQGVVEHARRAVQQHQDAPPAELEAGQVLAVAVAGEAAHIRALLLLPLGAQPLVLFLQLLQVRLQLVHVLAARERVLVIGGEFLPTAPDLGQDFA